MHTNKPLNIASFSDVHVFHPSTPTEHILTELKNAFPDTIETGKLDLIVIPGDFFDRINNLSGSNVGLVFIWITKFFKLCAKWDIKVRLLEGTPSHDRGQPELFKWISDTSAIGVDFKYVSVLSIEHINEWDVDILYIPDEWRSNTDDTWAEVKDLLAANNLTQVDFTLMHGMFEYHLPPGVHLDHHLSKRYQNITRRYVFAGHIHQSSKTGNILVAGSFDRNCHGDEKDKGHWRVYEGKDVDKVVFVPNKNAVIYKTISAHGLLSGEILSLLSDNGYDHLPMGSNVRLHVERGNDGVLIIDELNDMYENIKFTVKVDNPDVEQVKSMLVTEEDIETVPEVTPRNIVDLTLGVLNEKSLAPSGAKLELLKSHMASIM